MRLCQPVCVSNVCRILKLCCSEINGPLVHCPEPKKRCMSVFVAISICCALTKKHRRLFHSALINSVSTKFYIGTEDGHLVYVDWKPAKDNDTGKVVTQRASFWSAVQDGAVVTLQRNPFYKDIILCVGGWNFTVWKEGRCLMLVRCGVMDHH